MENNEPSDINQAILHIVSQYNHNQEDYHRNMRSFLNIMQNMNINQQPRNDNLYTFEFGLTDAANTLLSLFDPSRNGLSASSGLSSSGLSAIDISGGTTVSNYVFEDTGLICPITLEYVQVGEPIMRINRCGHRFKEAALRRWFSNHQRCPVCRGNV
jgi:hypothetical protein